jgi:DNA-3-methyladenine glycosylase
VHSAGKSPQSPGERLLPREFLARASEQVAPDLLGCVLEHETADGLVAVMLTEVEAYAGESDPASHAFRGRTARTAVMYGPPGHAYVYFTYGMHYCVNLVCSPEGEASAVLLRAGRVIDGEALARERRYGSRPAGGSPRRDIDLARGPARLCEALAIDRAQDGSDVCTAGSALRVLGPPAATPGVSISRGPRVGVSRAADVAWRFWLTGDPSVSAYRQYAPRRASTKPVTSPGSEGGTMPA